MGLWGGGGNFQRWGLVGGFQVAASMSLKLTVGPQPLPLALFSVPGALWYDMLLHPRPKAMESSCWERKPLQL
jgi:hypothetical protein